MYFFYGLNFIVLNLIVCQKHAKAARLKQLNHETAVLFAVYMPSLS